MHSHTHTLTHMHSHTHAHTHTYTHTYTHAHTYTHMHTHPHKHTHTNTCTHTQICEGVGAYLMADMAHISGLVAAGVGGASHTPNAQHIYTYTHT